tara:strand:+ start:145 stop:330 length:186 start_codon:yes stop_codon:yes gene_type:complete
MFPLAYIPPLWFKVMDHRLMALPHIGGDITRVNIDPDKKELLFAKYATSESKRDILTSEAA